MTFNLFAKHSWPHALYKNSSFQFSEKLWLCCPEPCAGLFHLAEDGCGLIFKKERSRCKLSCLIPVTQTWCTLFLCLDSPTRRAHSKLKTKGSECPEPTLRNSTAPCSSPFSYPDLFGSPQPGSPEVTGWTFWCNPTTVALAIWAWGFISCERSFFVFTGLVPVNKSPKPWLSVIW